MKKIILLTIIILSSFANLFAQSEAKIMAYNLLNYDSSVDTSRNTHFREIISDAQPDILVAVEINNQNSVDVFLNNVMKAVNSNYSAGDFIPNPDAYYDYKENAIFYNNTKFQFISNTPIHTALRDINEFKVVHISTGDTLRLYGVHLKASSGTTNENKRAAEVDELRIVTDALPIGKDFMVLGDFNFYNSSEPGYVKLLNNTNTGYFLDPINQPGVWHNDISFSLIHTQSTRASSSGDFVGGGLDDRFDFILISQAVKDSGGIVYKTGTYKAYGNDGNHFNKSINDQPTNTAVSATVLNALYNASDHLPVIATFQFFNLTGINDNNLSIPNHFELSQNYPNPFNPSTIIKYSIPVVERGSSSLYNVILKVYDVIGKEVTTLVNEEKPAGNYEVRFNAKNLTSGVYFYRLSATNRTTNFVQTKKMILMK